jgi:hypothetical protein
LDDLKQKTGEIVRGNMRKRRDIKFWDGKTADRIVELLQNLDVEIKKRETNAVTP